MSGMGARVGRSYPSHGRMRQQGIHASAVDRSGGGAGTAGTLSNWYPRRIGWLEEGRQRETVVARANDLAANHAHAASLIDSIADNSVHTGLKPQSVPLWKRLNISQEASAKFAEDCEWAFRIFSKEAGADGQSQFGDIQYQVIYSRLVNGEYLALPLMKDRPGRRFNLCIDILDPVRLRTPFGMNGKKDVRDGIRLGTSNEAINYFIADPADGRITTTLDLRHFKELPRLRGHRPVVMHHFHKKFPEQVRGTSVLAPAMKFFRDITDYLDFELVGAIVAASFPVWIEKGPMAYDATKQMGVFNQQNTDGSSTNYNELSPGGIFYGNQGEKPHVLDSKRPNNSFGIFLETILRAVGASAGMPYEVIAKDFSKTNYSSARAALQEAHRVFSLYQDWMVNHFCQPIWEMVIEEAWLRGMIELPEGGPDFYAARAEYCNTNWIGPKRGSVDPVKDAVAFDKDRKNNAVTLAARLAEQGKDYDTHMEQIEREERDQREMAQRLDKEFGPVEEVTE